METEKYLATDFTDYTDKSERYTGKIQIISHRLHRFKERKIFLTLISLISQIKKELATNLLSSFAVAATENGSPK